jgi:hypothetical protein
MKDAAGALELASVGTGRGEGEGGDEGWSAGASCTGIAAAEGREAVTKVCGDAVGRVAVGKGRGACFTLSPRRPHTEDKRMVLEHTHGLFIT